MTNLVNTQAEKNRSHTTQPNYTDEDESAPRVTLTTRQRVHSVMERESVETRNDTVLPVICFRGITAL